jgi:DNA polymerase (family X)
MPWANEDAAQRFAEIAELLKLTGADPFRVRAYERAAGALLAAPADLSTLSEVDIAALKGIGPSTASKVTEYLRTGRLPLLDELRAGVPAGLRELVRVPGLGPKTARLLHDELGVDSVEALRAAIEGERLRDVRGLGAKTEANLREALRRIGGKDGRRRPLADVVAVAEEVCERLRRLPEAGEVAYAGSLRRMCETVGDLDILVAGAEPGRVMDALRRLDVVETIAAAGEKKTSVLLRGGLQVDLRVVEPTAWGAALVYFTGSKAHNVRIRERAVRRGLMVNEYGVFEREGGRRLAGKRERDVYESLGLAEIPATLREDTGEVEAAAAGRLPTVVTVADVRGDLHLHSDWSGDGKASLAEMLEAAAARGYAYVAVTDHAENLPMNGLSRERMLARRRAIAELQARVDLRILDGAELNIGIDGSLDYDEDFLAGFDFCVASVHTLFQRPAAEQTERIVRALEHPAVNVLGHPTGRLIGRRPGYEIDLDAIVDAAVATGTAIEVNGSPRRLDLGGDLVRRVLERGATLAISSDAHSIGDLASIRYGVATAQRGWATPDRVLNCRELGGLLHFVERKRR